MLTAGPSSPAPIGNHELPGLFDCLRRYRTLIIAVSGGADSTALVHLLERWVRCSGSNAAVPLPILVVATVDHGLRPESVHEARAVAHLAGALGLPHSILTWRHDAKPDTGVQVAARTARYRLLEAFALGFPIPALVTAHHLDDQAETVVMRLARGSGLDGLAGIRRSRPLGVGTPVPRERPLLGLPKSRLVATLEVHGIAWSEDPSNQDLTFERARWRAAWPQLARLGLTAEPIARSAARLERARQALEGVADSAWSRLAAINQGMFATLVRPQFDSEPAEIRLRLLLRALAAFGATGLQPSLAQAEDLLSALATDAFATQTLAGCQIEQESGRILVFREPGRQGLPVLPLMPGAGRVWDNRFAVALAADFDGASATRCLVRALGSDGLAAFRKQVDALGLPARIAATLPSLWIGECPVAVPHLGHDLPGFSLRFLW